MNNSDAEDDASYSDSLMKSRRAFLRTSLLYSGIALAAGGSCLGAYVLNESQSRFDEVRYAIPWEFTDMNGDPFSYRGVGHGKPTVINFWASWCGPCRAEMPDYINMIERYGREPFRECNPTELFTGPVDFLMVSLDEELDELRDYVEGNNTIFRNNITFPVLLDESYNDEYGVSGIPCSLFIRRDGTIAYKHSGVITIGRLEANILNILCNE